MQLLSDATNVAVSPETCAEQLLDALPPVMRVVRKHMRSHRSKGLSLPQFRTLGLLRAAPAANLSAVADILGASLPTASRIVSGLVSRGFVNRKECPNDRRQVELALTNRGAAMIQSARSAARARLATVLKEFSQSDRDCLAHTLKLLHEAFAPGLRGEENGRAASSAMSR